jgi:hypothetical protein
VTEETIRMRARRGRPLSTGVLRVVTNGSKASHRAKSLYLLKKIVIVPG